MATTYLAWLIQEGNDTNVPAETARLRVVVARRPKDAAAEVARRCSSWGRPYVKCGVIRADLLESAWKYVRRYTVVFDRVVKDVRRAA